MKPILTIRIYEDIDKPHEIETVGTISMLITETINQLDLFNAIRNAIDERLKKQNTKLKGETNV